MSRRYRGGPADAGPSTPDTVIRSRETLRATAANAALLHGVDCQHLVDTLRLTGRPGEPVTAAWVYDTAAALARAGYLAPEAPPGSAVANDVLAAEAAGASRDGRYRARVPGSPPGIPRKQRRAGGGGPGWGLGT